jgi:ABC-type branched-subunit amino acid transport system substrate-binding protein
VPVNAVDKNYLEQKLHFISTVVALVFLVIHGTAQAQLRIGQTTGVTGAVAANIKESMLGASLYVNAVNAKGGVNGEKIEIITLDDKFLSQARSGERQNPD